MGVLERGVLHAMRHSNVKSECQLKQIKMKPSRTIGSFAGYVLVSKAMNEAPGTVDKLATAEAVATAGSWPRNRSGRRRPQRHRSAR